MEEARITVSTLEPLYVASLSPIFLFFTVSFFKLEGDRVDEVMVGYGRRQGFFKGKLSFSNNFTALLIFLPRPFDYLPSDSVRF